MEDNAPVGLHHRLALVAVGALLLGLVIAMPIAASSNLQVLLRPTAGAIVPIATPTEPSPSEYADIRVAVITLDSLSGLASLRVSGYYTCLPPCAGNDRIVLSSLDLTEDEADRVPRSVAVVLSATAPEVAQTLQLPVRGHALQYPFDQYEFLLGISLQRVGPDGRAQPLTAEEAADHLRLSIREALPNVEMSVSQAIDPTTVRPAGQPFDFLYVQKLVFKRPLYIPLTAVVMVCLTAMIAAFAVSMQPLRDLLIGAGGLILALWGIRDLLVPPGTPYTTLVDVGLGLIMGFVLSVICVRGFLYLLERNHIRVPRARTTPRAADGGERPPDSA